MSDDFRTVHGFEEVWRPPVRLSVRRPEAHRSAARSDARARLTRIVARTPEVMVKVTGRTRDPAHLAAHLSYITRNGQLPAEDRDGLEVTGHREVMGMARDWSAAELMDSRRRANSPMSIGLILSMPAGTDPIRLQDAARAFASETFAETHDYVLVLHTDTAHPHAHLTIRALAEGRRLNPRKAELELWRQRFAEALRERGVAAEATPRRARGVARKSERGAMRRLRERHEANLAPPGRVAASKLREAAHVAFGQDARAAPWEARLVRTRARIVGLYLAQARLLQASPDARDRDLAVRLQAFVREMPEADTERFFLARQLRALNEQARRSRAPGSEPRDRGR